MKKMLMSAWLRAFNQDSRGQMKCGGTIEWHSATSESGYLQPELQRSPSGGICLYQCPTWRDGSSALPKSNSRETMQLINPRHTIIPQPPSRQSTFGLQLPCSHTLGKKMYARLSDNHMLTSCYFAHMLYSCNTCAQFYQSNCLFVSAYNLYSFVSHD